MYQGRGANFVFPEAWEAYEAAIPANERRKDTCADFLWFFFNLEPLWTHSSLCITVAPNLIDDYIAAYGKRLRGEMGEKGMFSSTQGVSCPYVAGLFSSFF